MLESLELLGLSELASDLMLPACILMVALTVGLMLHNFINKQILQRLNVPENSLQTIFIRAMHGIPISLCLMTGLYWIVNTSHLPAAVEQLFSYILFTIIVFTITIVLERTLSGLVDWKLGHAGDTASQSTLLDTILKVIIYAVGVLTVLQYYGISITPIITAMGVGGMALALGLQETLANIFAGLQIIISRQLSINDYIRLGAGEEGRVMDINWRYTTIMPPSGTNLVVIPNKTIANSTTTNFSRPKDNISISIPVGVAYDSDLAHVEQVTLEVAQEVMERCEGEHDADLPEPFVRFHTFAESSIDFNVVLHSSRFDLQYLLKHEFIKALTKRYREENIDIPFPIRTVVQKDSSTDNPPEK